MLRRAKSKPLTRLPVVLDSMESRALADDAKCLLDGGDQAFVNRRGFAPHRRQGAVVHDAGGCSCNVPLGSVSTVVKVPGPKRRDGGVTARISIFLNDAPQLVIGIGCSGRQIPNPQAKERQQEKCPEHGHASFRILRLTYLHGAPPFRALPVIQTQAPIAQGNKADRSRRKAHNRRSKLSPRPKAAAPAQRS